MNEIKCPHCGEVFKVDASGYADIVKQVRNAEFSRDLDERVKAVQREGEQALELERSRSTAALQKADSQRNAQLVEQKNAAEQKLAQEVAKRDAELAELRAKLEGAATERESASQRAAVEARADAQKENAELQREIDNLRAQLERKDDEAKLVESVARNAAQNDLAARDAQIAELQARLAAADKAQEWRLPLPRQSRSASSMLLAVKLSARLLTTARRYRRSFPPQRHNLSKRPRVCVPSCASRN